MSPLRSRILSVVAVLGVTIPATAHTVHEQRQIKKAEKDLAALMNGIAPLGEPSAGIRKVTLNGAPVYFEAKSEAGPIDDVMARIARDCASGEADVALGAPASLEDGRSRGLVLERIVDQKSEGVRASLCIFTKEDGDDGSRDGTPKESLRRARYTLAHQRDDGTVFVSTVVNAGSTPLADLFPAEGDAPGSDLPGVARPLESRRILTALVGDEAHSARVYESTLPVERSIAGYDQAMTAFGYATTASLPEARMYRKDGRSYAVSFAGSAGGGSTVAIQPFETGGLGTAETLGNGTSQKAGTASSL